MSLLDKDSLSVTAAVIYQTLQRYAEGNTCTLSYKDLVKRSGYCKTAVLKALRELQWQQRIKKHSSQDGKMCYVANTYELCG